MKTLRAFYKALEADTNVRGFRGGGMRHEGSCMPAARANEICKGREHIALDFTANLALSGK